MEYVKLSEIPYGISGIYKLDFPNGKSYIGQSKDIKTRINRHNYPSITEIVVEKAINKYGKIEDFIILERIQDKALLDQKEKYWISYYDTRNRDKGYNIAEGGDGSRVPLKFNQQQLLEIANLILTNKTIRFQEIAEQYNCSINTLQKINQGISPYNIPNYHYPLRSADESRVLRAYIGEEKIKNILYDLKYTSITMAKIGEKYNLCRNTISDINKGKKEPIDDYDYPARKTKKGNTR